MREIGFAYDIESGVICRYKIQGIIVDIMPTNDPSIGFNNKWYPAGFSKAVNYAIDEKCTIKILSAPYFIAVLKIPFLKTSLLSLRRGEKANGEFLELPFIATKMEAFKRRGKNDGRKSTDFEDIVYVLENRKTIWTEINNSEEPVKLYLLKEFLNLLNNPNVFEWIDCHVERSSPPATFSIINATKMITS